MVRILLRAESERYPRHKELAKALSLIETLPHDRDFDVTIEPAKKRLPGNLASRIHICIRAIAEHCGYTESEFKYGIVKDKDDGFYPLVSKTWKGKTRMVPKDTMALTPDEARMVEAKLYELAENLGVVIPQPQSDT